MSCKASVGASVEGEKIDVSTRKFYVQQPRIKDGIKYYPFKLSIHGNATIEQPYDDPQNQVYYKTSMTSKGACVHGESLYGWSKKRLKEPNIKSTTGTHSAACLRIIGGSMVIVEASPREHSQSQDISSRHPPIVPELRVEEV